MATLQFNCRNTTGSYVTGYYDLDVSTGSSTTTTGIVATTSGTGKDILWTKTSGGAVMTWVTPPVKTAGTISSVTAGLAALESSASANAQARIHVYKRTAAGVETEVTGSPADDGTELPRNNAAQQTMTVTITGGVSLAVGDFLVIKWAITNIGTMGSGFTATMWYDGNTAATQSSITVDTDALWGYSLDLSDSQASNWNDTFTKTLGTPGATSLELSDSQNLQDFSPTVALRYPLLVQQNLNNWNDAVASSLAASASIARALTDSNSNWADANSQNLASVLSQACTDDNSANWADALATLVTPVSLPLTLTDKNALVDIGAYEYGSSNSYVIPTGLRDVYVDIVNGHDTSPGNGTQANPWQTITKAFSVALAGDVIHVLDGTYTEEVVVNKNGTVTDRIVLISQNQYGATISHDGSTRDHCIRILGSYVDIIGFDVTGGSAATVTFNAIKIDGSGGVGAHNVRILKNRVRDVIVPAGLGCTGINESYYFLDTDGHSKCRNNEIRGNLLYNLHEASGTTYKGVGIYAVGYQTIIQNNVIINTHEYGIEMWHAPENGVIANNTICYIGLPATSKGVGIEVGAGDAPGGVTADYFTVNNNLIYKALLYGIQEFGTTGTHNTYSNNLVNSCGTDSYQNGNGEKATVTSAPSFVNDTGDATGDYSLTSSSPAINAGSTLGAPSDDFNSRTRKVNWADANSQNLAGASTLTQACTDSWTLTDSLARFMTYSLVASDSWAFTDALAGLMTAALAVTDSFSLTDAFSAGQSIRLSLTDSLTLSDVIVLRQDVRLVLADSQTLADAASLGMTIGLAANDTFTFTDAFVSRFDYLLAITDSQGLTDAISSALATAGLGLSDSWSFSDNIQTQIGLVVSDSITLTDTFTARGVGLLAITDSLSLTDDFVYDLGLALITRQFTDSFALSDSFAGTLQYRQVLVDTQTLADTIAAIQNTFLTVSDTQTLTDTLVGQFRYDLAILDTLTFTDAYAASLEIRLVLADSEGANWQDVLAISSLAYNLAVNDIETSNWSDFNPTVALQYPVLVQQDLDNWADTLASALASSALSLACTDSFAFDDSISIGQAISLELADDANNWDDFEEDTITTIVFGEQIVFNDQIALVLETKKPLTDSWSFTDAIASNSGQPGLLLSVGDTLTFTDAFALVRGLGLSDSWTFTDAFSAMFGYLTAVADGISWSDGAAVNSGENVAVADQLVFTDGLTTLGTGAFGVQDQIVLSDTISFGGVSLIQLTPSDTLSLSDGLATQGTGAFAVNDTFSLSDALAISVSIGQVTVDSLSSSDSVSVGFGTALSDTATLTDEFSGLMTHSLALTDSLGLTDSFTSQLSQLGALQLADSLTLSDFLAIGYGVKVTDTQSLSDDIDIDIGLAVTDTDAANWKDAFARQLAIAQSRTGADTNAAKWLDAFAKSFGYTLSLVDTLSISDGCSLGQGNSLDDSLVISDNHQEVLQYLLPVTDSASASWNDQIGSFAGRPFVTVEYADSLALDDQIQLLLAFKVTANDNLPSNIDGLVPRISFELKVGDLFPGQLDALAALFEYRLNVTDISQWHDLCELLHEYRLAIEDNNFALADEIHVALGLQFAYVDQFATWNDGYLVGSASLLQSLLQDSFAVWVDDIANRVIGGLGPVTLHSFLVEMLVTMERFDVTSRVSMGSFEVTPRVSMGSFVVVAGSPEYSR